MCFLAVVVGILQSHDFHRRRRAINGRRAAKKQFSPVSFTMGFIWFPSSAAALPTTIVTALQLLDIILDAVSVALYRLGLNPSFVPTPWENEEFLFSAGPTPSVLADAALVKSRLQAVPYNRFVRRKGCGGAGGAAPLRGVRGLP
ncbi:hypothetical protein KSP40_PGU002097 [Platanthera guangdongensis]|uniref:Uncharacterized protein n=1 Tax=Platanthera guangdongensis TaxID=2320717 RepID=A0ABR2MNN3_9ASPA